MPVLTTRPSLVTPPPLLFLCLSPFETNELHMCTSGRWHLQVVAYSYSPRTPKSDTVIFPSQAQPSVHSGQPPTHPQQLLFTLLLHKHLFQLLVEPLQASVQARAESQDRGPWGEAGKGCLRKGK